LKPRRFKFFARVSGQYQNHLATIPVPIQQTEVKNTNHVLVRS
jgi:hypothetical protein